MNQLATTISGPARSALSSASIETFLPLSFPERVKLKSCEDCIERALEAGEAAEQSLIEIREKRLYREQYSTFEGYCEKRWKKGGRRMRQLMDFAEVKAAIVQGREVQSPKSEAPLPQNERQARALKQLPGGQRAQAWDEAVSVAGPGKQPTGKQVAAVVDGRLGKSKVQSPKSQEAELKLEPEPSERPRAGRHFDDALSVLAQLRSAGIGLVRGAVEMVEEDSRRSYAANHLEQIEDHARCLATLLRLENRERTVAQRADPTGFVICREPLKGATSPTAIVPRYDTGGGWTNDPAKAQIFADRSDAVVRAARHNDKVLELSKALRRFKHRL